MPELHLVSTPTDPHDARTKQVVSSLRAYFESGATKSLAWRLSQLEALEHFFMEREQDILEAGG